MAFNPHTWFLMGHRKGGAANTFIGGVASVINTPALLAAKLQNYPSGTAFSVANIQNFTIVGSDIECYIGVDYQLGTQAFRGDNFITNYFDIGKRLKNIPGNDTFYQDKPYFTRMYFPALVDKFGNTQGRDVINNIASNGVIYIPPFFATSNAGGEEGDIAFLRSLGWSIRYIQNFTAPNPITNLSIGTVYATAIQINFIAPTSANAIDFYEVYNGNKYLGKITASGQYIIGLTPNTVYNIEVKPVDIYNNKSTSNIVTQLTAATYYTDADANAYISAASLTSSEQESAYKLIVDLKANSLWIKTQAIYLFKGSSPLQHKFNAKNPVDTDASFRLIFNGTGTFSNYGYQCNGTNAYANTKFLPSVNQNVNSNGVTMVIGTNNAVIPADAWEVAAYIGTTQATLLRAKAENTTFATSAGLNTTTYATRTGINDAKGILTGSKTVSNVHKLIKNGVVLATSIGGGTLPNIPIYIGALNFQNTIVGNYSSQRIQMVIIHEGLSDTEVTTLHSIIDLSETIAGRKTW